MVSRGPDKGKRLELRHGSVLVGTPASCDLRLSDPTVSRQHLRIEMGPEGVRLTDLKSRNGTFLDASKIDSAVVRLGSRMKLGDTELRLDPMGQSRPAAGTRTEFFGLVGQSSAMGEVISVLDRAAKTDTTVLLLGETGSGKEVAARALHQASGRPGEFVVFDCGAAQSGVLASELFGHVKGAFTDARSDHIGAGERAHQGTLLLDEVGDLDPALQPSLLRLLERKEVQPVGASAPRKIDVRVVAATNRDLAQDVEAGRFRQDLYFRLAVLPVTLPPLRERMEDLPLLANKLLKEAGFDFPLSEAALATLSSYVWPGNVRELRNVLLRTVTLGGEVELTSSSSLPRKEAAAAGEPPIDYRAARSAMMARFEREYLINLLNKHQHNVSQAAKSAGIARAHLYRLMKRHQVD